MTTSNSSVTTGGSVASAAGARRSRRFVERRFIHQRLIDRGIKSIELGHRLRHTSGGCSYSVRLKPDTQALVCDNVRDIVRDEACDIIGDAVRRKVRGLGCDIIRRFGLVRRE